MGAKMVMSVAEFSASTRPAFFAMATRVLRSGTCEAAVATGSLASSAGLPGPDSGSDAQPGPTGEGDDVGEAVGVEVSVSVDVGVEVGVVVSVDVGEVVGVGVGWLSLDVAVAAPVPMPPALAPATVLYPAVSDRAATTGRARRRVFMCLSPFCAL
ncbi:hypothetical protein GCM10022226_26700 [Sphaerisporangium flaviroseum]|uniref:Uncharacterized protein n=1 Tax=Sphaerisporangium flaviroseum TaxID=509199 RepID=A0ABP7HZQ3_9ACTN